MKILYCLQDQEAPAADVLQEFWDNFRFREDILGDAVDDATKPVNPDVRSFTEHLVMGVDEHLEKIDSVLEQYSTNWSLDRMARVDLSLLRLSVFELLYCPDVPPNVAINEAIEIGKRYGTKETPGYVNGILDKIAASARTGK